MNNGILEKDISLQNLGFGQELVIKIETKQDGNGMRTKQQLLNNQAIVEKLKELTYSPIPETDEKSKKFYWIVKDVLHSTEHSRSKA